MLLYVREQHPFMLDSSSLLALVQNMQPIKSDARIRVGRARLGSREVIVKTLRRSALRLALEICTRQARPLKAAVAADRLRLAGVATPLVLAQYASSELGWVSLFEDITGAATLREAVLHSGVERCREQIEQAVDLLAQLHRAGLSHGDAKWANVLCCAEQQYLIDLDACRTSNSNARHGRDLGRFSGGCRRLGSRCGAD